MIVPKTPIRIYNSLTRAEHTIYSPLPDWLIRKHLDQISMAPGPGAWDVMIHHTRRAIKLYVCPRGLAETIERVHEAAEGRVTV